MGCPLYYLLTGKAVYDGDSLMKKLLAHREQPIPALRASRPEVTEQVEAVFQKMVAKTVHDRYQTMEEVIAALEGCGPRPEPSISTQPSLGSSSDTGLTNFFRDISLTPPIKPVAAKKAAKPLIGQDQKKWLLIGGGILGVLILLAGLMVTLKTKDGTLVVTVNEPELKCRS